MDKGHFIKCLAIDLDGTLIFRKWKVKSFISKENIDALKEYCRSGENKVVISTGKSFIDAWKVFGQLKASGLSENEIPYMVCSNGCSIWTTSDPYNPLYNESFGEYFCRRTMEVLRNEKINYFFLGEDGCIYHPILPLSFLLYRILFRARCRERNLRASVSLRGIQKILVVAKEGRISKIKAKLDEEFGRGNYCLSKCCGYCWEIIDARVDKYTALEKIANRLGLRMDEVGAIGNGENDLRSLRNVGCGIGLNLEGDGEMKMTITDLEGDGVSRAIHEMKNRGLW